ncbi:MAG: hypothetical protein JKY65_29600 [Planctomycetes bacterium]|nr:hypothetical protein [Planctomycetota bacterium]
MTYSVFNATAENLVEQLEGWKRDHDENNLVADVDELYKLGLYVFQRVTLADGMVPHELGSNAVRQSTLNHLTRLFQGLASICGRLPVDDYDYEVSTGHVGQVLMALEGMKRGKALWRPVDTAGADANLARDSVVSLEELRDSLA